MRPDVRSTGALLVLTLLVACGDELTAMQDAKEGEGEVDSEPADAPDEAAQGAAGAGTASPY